MVALRISTRVPPVKRVKTLVRAIPVQSHPSPSPNEGKSVRPTTMATEME